MFTKVPVKRPRWTQRTGLNDRRAGAGYCTRLWQLHSIGVDWVQGYILLGSPRRCLGPERIGFKQRVPCKGKFQPTLHFTEMARANPQGNQKHRIWLLYPLVSLP